MTDLSKLSDAELKALYAAPPAKPLEQMNDDELRAAHKATAPSYTGRILPFSNDAAGHSYFDSNAGILGSLKRAFMLPGDVAAGKVQLPSANGVPGSVPADTPGGDEAIGRVFELATVASPVNPMVRAGDRAIPGAAMATRAEKPKVPTTQELAKAGGADIQAGRNSGLDVTASSVSDYSRRMQQKLYDDGIHPVDAPNVYAKLKELENAPAGAFVTASNLQSLRESFQATAQNFNPTAAKDQLAASRAIRSLDEFIPSLAPKDILAGTPAATQALFERGRGNYAAAQRSNNLTGTLDRANTGIIERAEVRAQAANSGRNLDNTIRSKAAALLEKPKEISGYSDDELAALGHVVEGGAARNTARQLGNWLGGGGGLGQTSLGAILGAGGFAAGGVPGAVVAGGTPFVVGTGARALANQLAKRDLRGVDELVRQRSPLYQERVANPNMQVIDPEGRAALARYLLLQEQADQQRR